MRGGEDEVRDEILLLGIEVDDADTAALLLAVFRRIGALDIAALGQDQDGLFIGDQVLGIEILDAVLDDLGAALVAVLGTDVRELGLDDAADLLVG